MRQKMKKAVTGILAAAMLVSFGATTALAAGPGYGRNFTDTNLDGICDNCGRIRPSEIGWGRNFVDADGDGICDNYGTGQKRGPGGRCNR